MKRFALPLLLIFILAACAPSPEATENPAPLGSPVSDAAPTPNVEQNGELARVDEQGAVIIEVTPLNFGTSADTLEFGVVMNTHSVDLSMGLATLATLTTDTGVTVQASKWDTTRGGHHVEGRLIFPTTQAGKPILEGANKLTLTIVNVDAASRLFEWELK